MCVCVKQCALFHNVKTDIYMHCFVSYTYIPTDYWCIHFKRFSPCYKTWKVGWKRGTKQWVYEKIDPNWSPKKHNSIEFSSKLFQKLSFAFYYFRIIGWYGVWVKRMYYVSINSLIYIVYIYINLLSLKYLFTWNSLCLSHVNVLATINQMCCYNVAFHFILVQTWKQHHRCFINPIRWADQ